MTNSALLTVESAERRGALFEQRVLGYPVWPLERLKRYHTELLDGRLVESTGPSVPMRRRLASMRIPIRQAVRDARELSLASVFDRRDVWVLATSNYRRADERGVPQCIFAEDLRRQLGARLVPRARPTPRSRARDVMHSSDHLGDAAAKAGGALLERDAARPAVVEALFPLSASCIRSRSTDTRGALARMLSLATGPKPCSSSAAINRSFRFSARCGPRAFL